VVFGPVRVGGREALADVARVGLAEPQVLPGVRIGDPAWARAVASATGSTTAVVVAVALQHGAGLDALGGGGHGTAVARGAPEPVEPRLETEAVSHHQPGAAERLRVGGARLGRVSVGVRTDQGAHSDPLAADLARRVGEDREGGDHGERASCLAKVRAVALWHALAHNLARILALPATSPA
jgi:hypothetical protein